MEIKIEKGVPMPMTQARPWNARVPDITWPFGKMEVGDSFFAGGRKLTNISATVCGYARYHGKRFTYRTVTENGVRGVRIWRTA